ncbi:unnamed protein product [Trypanosoma congolense IL3000]|uniref:WGS project CAEQ00000000 data, annotated contig 2251 n=1 Tax=Trypanosoma congolense (strain IL3000) TaxID=1068625 RepID=F9WCN5_TRYCI|nr:unnamed protein product [Trypanosoma congolense IL3000]
MTPRCVIPMAPLLAATVTFVVAENDQEPADGKLNPDATKALCTLHALATSLEAESDRLMANMRDDMRYIENTFASAKAKQEGFGDIVEKMQLDKTGEMATKGEFAETLAAIAKARDLAKKQLSVAANVSRVAVRHAKEAIGKANGTGLNAVMLTYCNTTKPSGRSSRWFKVTNGTCGGGLVVPLNGSIYRIDCAGAAKPDASAVGSVTYQTMMLALRAWEAHKPKPKSMASDWKSTARREQKGCSKDGYSSEVACTASEKGWVGHYNSSAKELRKLEGASHAMQAAATEAKKQFEVVLALENLVGLARGGFLPTREVGAECENAKQGTRIVPYLIATAVSFVVVVPGFLLCALLLNCGRKRKDTVPSAECVGKV